ncbi:gem-associated protein 5 [Trichonephila clavata]|uniref:Gem-associated protein 5 n=1 Tax=Trichonephila clavata TaxID=2740835 RepID=A0A8X6I8J9_TRICU|nr:gem-associated protein 5 [Trichonephila clavata]
MAKIADLPIQDHNYVVVITLYEIFPIVETGDTNSEGLPISEKKPLTETDRKQLKAQGLSRKGVPQLYPFHSLISDTSKENDLKDCLQLADALKKKKKIPFDETQMFDFSKHSMNIADEDILKLGPFMDQMTALKMLEVQAENFKPKETFRHFCHLSVMSSNIKALIEYAAANKKLSNFHVSLAPSVSSTYWFEVCEKYAKQLLEAHQYNQACMYLLICNKVNEAIDIWADKIDVIEALILAKARLPESDPKIRNLLLRARKRYISHNNQARVAKCYLALDQPFTAAKTLFNVSDPKFMKAGIHIAKLYELDDIAKKYVFLYMVKCLSLDDWNALTELVNEEPSMKGYSSLFAVHKAFKIHLQYLGKTDEDLEEEILFQPDSSKPLKFWIGSTCMESKESFVKYVYRILLLNNLLPSKTDEILDILKVLGNMFTKKETYDCEIQADILISLCITQFIFYCILEDRTAANFYFLKIFESSFNETFLLKAVCSLFIPLSLSWNCNTHSIICESRIDNNEENDADAVMCHFHNINQAIAEEIMSFRLDYFISKFYSQDDCPLSPLHENVVDVLKRKPVNEYALAYFIANLAQNLMRLVEKREMICYAEKTCLTKLQKEDIKPIIPSEKLEDGLLIQTSSVHDLKTEDESNKKMLAINSEEEKEIKNLIEIVLEEAEEKAKLLSKSKANSAPGNVVDYDASMQESKILEDNSQCISIKKKSCVDINDENSSKIVTGTNVTNDAELPKKLMNDERNEKECSVISSNDENLAISQCIDLEKKTVDEEKSSNIITGTDIINDAELPKNPVIEENNEKECFMISSGDENLEISQCIDLEKKSCADINEESSKIITGTDVTNDAEFPKKFMNEERNEKECSTISSNDENLAISQCINLEKKTVDEEKSPNIITGTAVINGAELPKNPVIEGKNEKECFVTSSSDENLEISQCIDLEKKSCADINEEESSKIISGTDVTNDAELPKKLINEGRNEKECLRISSSDENSHVQCLAKSNLFLNVALFIISSISKQKFSYAPYSSESACIKKSELLKDTKKKIESYDELNGKMDKIISSETEESHSSGSFEIIENGEIANMMVKTDEKEKNDNDKKQIELSKINDNVNGIPSAKSNNMEINNFDKILTEPSTNNSETDEVQTSVPNESNMECDKNILNAENTGCNLVVIDSHYNSDSSEMGQSSLSESCANSFQIISPFGEDILKELKIIEGKIHVLIKESQPSLLSYPVPFEMLQNVFQVIYSMWKKSECSAVREELHKYMEQIKQYGKMEFGCEICFSK